MKTLRHAAVLVLFVLSACSALGNTELKNARSRWEAAKITHYSYQLHVGCFCAFVEKMPLSIEVKDGQVVSMAYKDGTPVSAEEQQMFERYSTIDKLFDFTAESIQKADEIHVKYDPTYGFPSQVQIDFVRQAADDELTLEASGLKVVK